jgi:chorismate mutase / prephenate dehydratase
MPSDDLQTVRNEIDQLDLNIHSLLNDRAVLAQRVAEIKKNDEPGQAVQFYRPDREADVLRRVMERNTGPLESKTVAKLFREIMSACLALEQPMTVAFLGPDGTYTQEAATKHFGHAVSLLPLDAIDEVFRETESGQTNYGVVPIENSTEGVINHTLDALLVSSLRICGEVELRIHHHLLSQSQSLSDIKRIYSHQQSFAQCREWLDQFLPGVERIPVRSNGEAAKLASATEHSAAIASRAASEIYDLNIIVSKIEDQQDNTTRFLVVGHEEVDASECNKTSLIVSAKNSPGALHDILVPFSTHNVNMTRIESRPSKRGLWEYVFFIDIEGHQSDNDVIAAMADMRKSAAVVKVLGSYPQAVL